MSKKVEVTVRDGVAIVAMTNAPVNALGLELRQALFTALETAIEDAACQAIVLIGKNGQFSAGADIKEFASPKAYATPTLSKLLALVHSCPKPVVAAIEGVALGGGLELALAAGYRVIHKMATIGLPEVELGLIPGAGGTQRLPRIVGIGVAAKLIATAQRLSASTALELGVVDQVVEEDLLTAAIAFAKQQVRGFMAQAADVAPILLTREDEQQLQSLRQQLAKRKRGYQAPLVAVECVEQAAQLSLQAGLAYEREQFQLAMQRTESKALRYLFQAQRRTQEGLSTVAPIAEFSHVAVIGGGLMGRGIAMSLVDAGLQVVLVEQNDASLHQAMESIKKAYQGQVDKAQITTEQLQRKMQAITALSTMYDLGPVDLVIEAIVEDMDVKQAVFQQLDSLCAPATVFASNTSRLDINVLAAVTQRPERFLGLHFFSPANRMPLLEVVQGDKTSKAVMAQVMSFAKRLRKVAVPVRVCEGFVGNRMLTAYRREASFLLEEGASVTEVDTALYDFGMAMGPFVMTDMAGLDISWAARKRLAASADPSVRDSKIGDTLCEMGRFGQKSLAGYYRYDAGSRTPIVDPIVAEVIQQCAQQAGITQQAWSAADIVKRTMYALINEGVHLLAEGIAQRASDIDLVYVHGYGFPAYRGGPMFYADTIGLAQVYQQILDWEQQYGKHWKPSPLFAQLVQQQKMLADYQPD